MNRRERRWKPGAARALGQAVVAGVVCAASCVPAAPPPAATAPRLGVLRVRDDVAPPQAPAPQPPQEESLEQIRYRLLEEQDTDCDQKITKNDQGSRRFQFRLQEQPYELNGSYVLSNLLQELSVAHREGGALRMDRVMEDPLSRTSRLIREVYWPALTRRADESGLPRLLEDPKQPPSGERYLYVPAGDEDAFAHFRRAGRRYDAAYRKLAEGAGSFPFGDLRDVATSEDKRRTLLAMLRTEPGRDGLRDVSRRLASLLEGLGYPALEQRLASALASFDDLVAQAARPCVQASTQRLGRVAERSARELGAFSPRQVFVKRLPERETWVDWTAALGARHGALTLALTKEAGSGVTGVPYVVPGGRFDEMYGWDSYFIVLGLLEDGRLDLARGLVDNFVYVIEHYGATLNANRTYYLTRSQPPFFTSMLRAVWEATPAEARDAAWLRRAVAAALSEYDDVWTSAPRRVGSLCRGEGDGRVCLSRYAGMGKGQPPEVEPGHFDWLYANLGRSLERSYAAGQLAQRDLTAELDRAFRHDRCMRESGHDTTYRWFWKSADESQAPGAENRCGDMATVDLNSLLYKYEIDLAYLIGQVRASRPAGSAPEPAVWCERAKNRMALMKQYLWSARDGLFYDVFLSKDGPVQTGYVSATTLYPLWATALSCAAGGSSPPPISAEEASALVTSALEQLEAPGGLLATARASRERFSGEADRQWEYPNGWAPHQMLAWVGLDAHGFHQDAERLAFAWLYTLLTNVVDQSGTIPEKYDVVQRTHAVFSEYGNVGTEFDYIAPEGFGWVNASFQVGTKRLSAAERSRLLHAAERR